MDNKNTKTSDRMSDGSIHILYIYNNILTKPMMDYQCPLLFITYLLLFFAMSTDERMPFHQFSSVWKR